MDAVELLKHDHRMVEQLFRDYDAAHSEDQRRGVVEILVRELSKHAALEELSVYPLAKQQLGSGVDVDRQLDEHMAVKKTLASLDSLPVGSREERPLVDELEAELHQHIELEESQFLPALERALNPDFLAELGKEIELAKRAAPTRPHPGAPDEPPALTLAAPFAALFDRFRDRIQGRPAT
ncbi:MAG: hemerythrin domain-containing protein [Acidimicrobiaceae bacterium]|nr:hemerythrin domain-containing protein [Acidimicrobiaceae bacterium]